MLYLFAPLHPGECGYAYPGGPVLVSGDGVELDAAQAERLNGIVAGAHSGPALVLVNAWPAVVADIAEDPRPSATVAPVGHKPKAKPRSK